MNKLPTFMTQAPEHHMTNSWKPKPSLLLYICIGLSSLWLSGCSEDQNHTNQQTIPISEPDAETDEDSPIDASESEKTFGQPCTSNEQCKSELCVPTDEPNPTICNPTDVDGFCGYCSRRCETNGDCLHDTLVMVCDAYRTDEQDTDYIRACRPPTDITCVPCEDGAGNARITACSPSRGNQCLPFPDGYYCTNSCENDHDSCPAGTYCVSRWDIDQDGSLDELPFSQCIPTDKRCSPCIDHDGDGYGQGQSCLGYDCDDTHSEIHPGAVEYCDSIDHNCDDRLLPIGLNTDTSEEHCGACGSVCSPPGAAGQCNDGQCGIGRCLPGFYDLNGDPSDGCEYVCTTDDTATVDLPDIQRIDSNCDGIDGTLSKAIFVAESPSASDDNPGTIDAPVRHLDVAIERAKEEGLSQILVAGGQFSTSSGGSVILTSGISIFGGYEHGHWSRPPGVGTTIIVSESPVTVFAHGIDTPTTLAAVRIEGTSVTASPGQNTYAMWIADSNEHLRLEEIVLLSGNAGHGIDGANGKDGAHGSPGQSASTTFGGEGGQSACGAYGGDGGDGRTCDDGGSMRGSNGRVGWNPYHKTPSTTQSSSGGQGGLDKCRCKLRDRAGDAPSEKANGGPEQGDDGLHGRGGDHPAAASFIFSESHGWSMPPSSRGDDGHNGGGGGGGGSGGSDRDGPGFGCKAGKPGTGAGGGGAGGCAGEGGAGGSHGGGSFGLVLNHSSPVMIEMTITRGHGGNGGNGGDGGNGGASGPGGAAYAADDGGAFSSEVGSGAHGAHGGEGGSGGGGAGGCGGPSVGVVLLNGSEPDLSGLTVSGGQAGDGGNGGDGGVRSSRQEDRAPSGEDGLPGDVWNILEF